MDTFELTHQGCGHTQTTAPASPENTAIPAAQPDPSTDTDCPSWRGRLPGPAALHDSISSTTPVWRDWAVFREMGIKHKMFPERRVLSGTAGRNRRFQPPLGDGSAVSRKTKCALCTQPQSLAVVHLGMCAREMSTPVHDSRRKSCVHSSLVCEHRGLEAAWTSSEE